MLQDGSGFRVLGFWFIFWSFRIWDSGFNVHLRVVQDVGFGGFGVSGFRIWGLGCILG